MKKITLIIVVVFSVLQSFGQVYFDMITRYMIDTAFLYQQVRKGIADNHQFSQQNNYLIYPIFQFADTKTHAPKDYLDYSFLNTLTTLHRMPTKNMTGSGWLSKCDRILIVNHKGIYMGQVDTYSFCSYYKCESDDVVMIHRDAALSDLLYNHVFDYIFATTEYHSWDDVRIYFGVNKKRKNVSVLFFTDYGIKAMTMEEVVNEHWDDFRHGAKELKKDIYHELKHSFDSVMKDVPHVFCYF